MHNCYDVVVVGAGPAGSVVARQIAEAGFDVLLVEKRQEIGSPVRCAEGVDAEGLSRFIKPDPRWIAARIKKYRIFSPDGNSVTIPLGKDTLWILERRIFDRELANLAARAGCTVRAKTRAYGLVLEGKRVRGVHLATLGTSYTVKSKIVIGADGVESQVGRWGGLHTVPKMNDIAKAAQYLIANADVEQDMCEFHLGRQVAPRGYAWVFPKGNAMANVGLGISGDFQGEKTTYQYLQDFVFKRFPGTSTLGLIIGGIPVSGGVRRLVADGLMIVGDAAHQADPFGGGGILTAMTAAALAAKVAIDALASGDCSMRRLQVYEQEWHNTVGKELKRLYRIKQAYLKQSDDTLNEIMQTVARFPSENLSLEQIIFTVFREKPKLLLEIRHLLR